MMAHFDLSMTAAPIMTSGVIQGFGDRPAVRAAEHRSAYVTLNPIHRTEGTIVATMARSLGSSLGISMMSATLTNESALAHARMADRINCGDPVLGATLPGALNPCSRQHRSVQRRGDAPGGDDRLRHHLRLDGALHRAAAAIAAADAPAAAGDHGGDRDARRVSLLTRSRCAPTSVAA